MKNTKYTISELEKLTGINRRTIYFYSKKEMIPGPETSGRGAKYGEESYLRLRLIKELQKSHLKLSGIKKELDAMGIDKMRSLVKRTRSVDAVGDKEDLENSLQKNAHPAVRLYLDEMKTDETYSLAQKGEDVEPLFSKARMDNQIQEPLNGRFSFRDIGSTPKRRIKRSQSKDSYLRNLKRRASTDLPDTNWTRVSIADGIELNIRSDIKTRYSREIDKLIRDLKKNSPKGGH